MIVDDRAANDALGGLMVSSGRCDDRRQRRDART
jgi:hypothetical protein